MTLGGDASRCAERSGGASGGAGQVAGAPQPRVSLAPMAAGNLPLINVQHSRDGGRHSEAVVCFELGHATDYVSER